jgi:hypothetical protein
MSDPGDGEEPTEAPEGASDEEVRAAMSRVSDGPSPGREPHDRVPVEYGSDGGESDDDDDGPAAADSGNRPDPVGGETDGSATDGPDPGTESADPELRQADLSAPASAGDGDHTLLEEYEREQEPAWKSYARTAAFWGGATLASVALTTTAFVSLVESGLSQGVAFFAASVALAIVVGFVFLSLNRG